MFEAALGVAIGVTIAAHLLVMLLTAIGLLWSPVAAKMADRRRADTCGSAKASASMFLPWFYVRRNLLGTNPMSSRTIRFGYGFAFILWLLGPAGFWAGFFLYVGPIGVAYTLYHLLAAGEWRILGEPSTWRDEIIGFFVSGLLVVFIAYACLLDRRVGLLPTAKKVRALHSRQAAPSDPPGSGAIPPRYLAPFALVTTWAFVTPVFVLVIVFMYWFMSSGYLSGHA